MNKVEASNLLKTNLDASAAELEKAFRKRREEVRKRFEAARDRSDRTRCEREYFALEQAHDLLHVESDDFLKEDERSAAKSEKPVGKGEELEVKLKASSVGREGQPVDRGVPAVEIKAASLEREMPAIESKGSPVRHDEPAVERDAFLIPREELPAAREKLPLGREVSPVRRVGPVVERRSLPINLAVRFRDAVPPPAPLQSPIKRVSEAVPPALLTRQGEVRPSADFSLPTKRPAEPRGNSSPPNEHLSPVKTLEPVLTLGRNRAVPRGWPAIAGVMFVLVSLVVLVFFLLRTPGKPKPSTVAVNTVPDQADVWLDGTARGETPLILREVIPGDRRLTIELPGYRTEELIVSVKPGDELSTRIVQLVPVEPPSPKPTGSLSPASRPQPASVPPTGSPAVTQPRDSQQ